MDKISNIKERISSTQATNKSPLYNSMLYWSQKPYNITDILIEELIDSEGTVFDPFMGSGVTLIESLRKNYKTKSIGVDINDMPIFLCKNSISLPSESVLNDLKEIAKRVSSLNKEYQTECECCHSTDAIIQKTVYDIKPSLNINTIYYKCTTCNKAFTKKPSAKDEAEFSKSRHVEGIVDLPLIENSRIAVKNGETISCKFSQRNYYILSKIKEIINEYRSTETQTIANYIFASIIHKAKILDVKMSSQWPLWIPSKNCLERNAAELYIEAIKKYILSRTYVAENYYSSFVNTFDDLDNNTSLIIKSGIQNINQDIIPNESVDLVITDPPYLGQVPYSEYMQLYQPFLNNSINYDDEIIITNAKNRKKDYDDYISLLSIAFSNISRVMKSQAYMCMYFHDSKLSIWSDLIDIINQAGFSFVTSIHIHKNQKTLKKILDPKKTMNGESLIIFRKEKSITYNQIELTDNELFNLKEYIKSITSTQSLSTTELYDNGVLSYIIEKGLLKSIASKYNDLTDIFSECLLWNAENGLWEMQT